MFSVSGGSTLDNFGRRLNEIFLLSSANSIQGLANPTYRILPADTSMISAGNELEKYFPTPTVDKLATEALRLFREMGLITQLSTVSESTHLLPASRAAAAAPVSGISPEANSVNLILGLLSSQPGNQVLVCPVRCADGVTRNLHQIHEDRGHSRSEVDYHLSSFVFSAAAKALLSAIWNNLDLLISTVTNPTDNVALHTRVRELRETRQAMLRDHYQDAQIASYLTELKIKYPSQIAYDSSRNYNFYASGTSLTCGTSLITGLSLLCAHLYIPSAIFGGLCAASCMYSATDAVCYAPKRMTCLEAWCLAKPIDIPSVVREIKQNLLVSDVLAQQPTS